MRWIRHPGRALDVYLDGELDGRDVDRVASHVSHCLLCRQRAAVTCQIRASLRAMAGQTRAVSAPQPQSGDARAGARPSEG